MNYFQIKYNPYLKILSKTLFFCLFLLKLNGIIAQNYYSKLYSNDLSRLNPAYVGMCDKTTLTFHTNEDFSDIPGINSSIGRVGINIPIKKLFSGIGLHSTYDKYNDNFSFFDLGAIYSLKFDLGNNISVAFGSNFNIQRTKMDDDRLIFLDELQNDMSSNQTQTSKSLQFFIDVGLWIKIFDFQIGVTNNKIEYSPLYLPSYQSTTINNSKKSYNAILNYYTKIGQNNHLKNTLLFYNLPSVKAFNLNNMFYLSNMFIFGVTSYIPLVSTPFSKFHFTPNVGFNLNDRFTLITNFDLLWILLNNNFYTPIEGVLSFKF